MFFILPALAFSQAPGFPLGGITLVPKCDSTSKGYNTFFSVVKTKSKDPFFTVLENIDGDGNTYIPGENVTLGACNGEAFACPSDTIINNIFGDTIINNIIIDTSQNSSVYSISHFSDTTNISNPVVGSIAIIDTTLDCKGKGFAVFDGDSWSDLFIERAAQDDARVLYVDPNGDDTKAKRGNPACAFDDPLAPSLIDHQQGDLIKINPGVYTWGTDVAFTVPRSGHQLARAGEEVNYYLESGVKFVATNTGTRSNPFGFGEWGDLVEGVKLTIDGNGEFEYNSSALSIAIPAYGRTSSFNLKLKSLITTGRGWGVQIGCAKSNVQIDYIDHGTRCAYSSWSEITDPSGYKWNRHFESNLIVSKPGLFGGSIRQQSYNNFLPGTTDVVEVGAIVIEDSQNGFAYMKDFVGTLLTDSNQGVGGSFTAKFTSITNKRKNALTYSDYLEDSNFSPESELHFPGGDDGLVRATNIFVSADMITSAIPAISLNGIYLDSLSQLYIKIGQAITTDAFSIGTFSPHLSRGSRVVIEGELINTSGIYPVGNLSGRGIDSTSEVVFKNVTFKSKSPGVSPLRITQDNDSFTYVFDNCKFVNSVDNTVPPVSTNSTVPLSYSFFNCFSNADPSLSSTEDSNIIEIGSPIVRDKNIR